MDLSVTGLVERLKGTAARVGTQGVRMLVESSVAAVRVVDEFQALLAQQRRMREKREPAGSVGAERLWVEEPTLARPRPASPVQEPPEKVPRERRQAAAERVLAEAHAAEARLRVAQPARRPLKAQAEDETAAEPARGPSRKTARATGRKTLAAASPKRATEKKGFKAKRGQKHRH